jgi:fructose-bisphosphate aldolase class I
MDKEKLIKTAQAMVAPGKGVLAADESTGTATRRLESVDVASTPETRRAYRRMLMTTEGIEEYISGVIMYDETVRQTVKDDLTFPEYLSQRSIIPGIKVDEHALPLANFPGERVTEGLDQLRDRFIEYAEMGNAFAKWRAVISIGEEIPTRFCLLANAHALARYAALAQEQNIVPIVEPEVLMDGDHSIERCAEVTEWTLRLVFDQLMQHRVLLEGMLLKPNMVISGEDAPEQAGVKEVAEATVRTMRRVVPAAVPGIVFLSGGQSAERATAHLNAMNQMGPQPWELSFSYGRALQQPSLHAWQGKEENVPKAQRLFYLRAKLNSAARHGDYSPEMEPEA